MESSPSSLQRFDDGEAFEGGPFVGGFGEGDSVEVSHGASTTDTSGIQSVGNGHHTHAGERLQACSWSCEPFDGGADGREVAFRENVDGASAVE
jgi:hypothetical protein